jgi:hypothetical protein
VSEPYKRRFMNRFTLGCLLALLCVPAHASHPDTSGDGLLRSCREATLPRPANEQDFHQGYCSGVVLSTLVYNPGGLVCQPKTADLTQAIKVVIRYMEQHPQDRREDLSLVTIKALHEAWPCPASPSDLSY